ncbi:hypothetical protein MCOR25_006235 [Pyricularia grisea]|uniref:Kelch repeat-containing protein n=1 Tax=Pyricularia grisea TaxID=148305 RepID=A0A6P8B190_PYRGI|nr:uncharacterized protein PgNI_07119 [Pyricularia grisea]KAI6362360.1 hypothetical protein MCOR25_006235 [Pyricularia grisea]TLD08488.1 hypothetical protein PgNI_07119 [Pyricularia grisea]
MHHRRYILSAVAALSSNIPSAACHPLQGTKLGSWQDLGPIALQPRQEHTTVALNETTFAIVGGIIPAEGSDGGNTPDSWATTDMFQLYDTATGEWSLGPTLPFAVNHANTIVVDGKVYLLGGLAPDEVGNWVKTGQSYVLDGIDDGWKVLQPIPDEVSRGSASVGAAGDLIFLAGGMTQLIPQDTIASVIAYNVTANEWITDLPDLPEPRDHAGSAVIDGTLYIVGGRAFGQNNTKDTVFALNLDDAQAGWKTKEARMPTPRGGVAAAAIGNKIYTFGGEGNQAEGSSGVFSETEAYDVVSDSWERLQKMEVPRHGSWAVAIGEGVYLPGGGVRQGGAAVDRFDVFWLPAPSK